MSLKLKKVQYLQIYFSRWKSLNGVKIAKVQSALLEDYARKTRQQLLMIL